MRLRVACLLVLLVPGAFIAGCSGASNASSSPSQPVTPESGTGSWGERGKRRRGEPEAEYVLLLNEDSSGPAQPH